MRQLTQVTDTEGASVAAAPRTGAAVSERKAVSSYACSPVELVFRALNQQALVVGNWQQEA